jgi:uncharacterized sulfatase
VTRRPNILFILVDDQAAWTLSGQGHPNTHTPQLDQLAAQGATLSRLFSTGAVCSPARASVLTGLYPSQTGLAPDGDVVHLNRDSTAGLTPGIVTWPALLRQAGYCTALLGKWHVGHATPGQLPQAHGYDLFTGWPMHGHRSRDPEFLDNGIERHFPGQYTSDVLADLAIKSLGELRGRPFALSLHFWAPHANHDMPQGYAPPHGDRTWLPMKDEDLARWRDRPITLPAFANLDVPRVTRMTREYLASVHSVDRNVGRVLRHLDELGLADETVVIFTSDHGFNLGHHGLWHKGNGGWVTVDRVDPTGTFRGHGRQNLFDTSMQVPGIVRWPGRIAPGTRVDQSLSFVDWLPTLLDMAGLDAAAQCHPEGRSFLPLMQGGRGGGHDAIFAQHHTLRACRTGQWKLVRDLSASQCDELYDLVDDPGETTNRIADASPRVDAARRDLDAQLQRWMKAIQDPLFLKRTA